MADEKTEGDALVSLAKKAVQEYVKTGKKPCAPDPVPAELQEKAGVFVCLKKQGQLRGCIGTIEPVQQNLAHEVIENAVSAAIHDPRFFSVESWELDDLEYSVDVLGAPERISGMEELDPKRYGVIVESGARRGLLLPDLEGVDTPEYQVSIAMSKAGIRDGEPINLYRFQVIRHV